MQLTVQQPDLASMFGPDNLYSTLYGMQRQDQANANNAQNLGQAQQEQQFQADLHPTEMQQAAANVGHTQALTGLTNAQTPGAAARSQMEQTAAQVDSSIPMDQKRAAAIQKLATGLDEDTAKQHVARATNDLFATNPDGTPDVQKRSDAQLVLQNMPEVIAKMRELKQMGDNSARVAGIEAGSREHIEKMQEEAGKYNKFQLEFMMKQAGAKANFQQQAGIAQMQADDALNAASRATDPDEKKFYQDKATQFLNQKQEAILNDYRAKQAAGTVGNAGKPNLNALGVPTVVQQGDLPAPPIQPDVTGQAPSPTKLPPKPGSQVVHGGKVYKFKGGDPSNQANWEQQ